MKFIDYGRDIISSEVIQGYMNQERFTRGKGLLENFLAQRRCFTADHLITIRQREGRILDIGCGTVPYFLLNTKFKQKHGIDPHVKIAGFSDTKENLTLHNILIKEKTPLPFNDNYFDVITLLGVIEHFTPEQFMDLLKEIRRLLKPQGRCILTTPSPWSAGLLQTMSKLHLISIRELEGLKASYSKTMLKQCFTVAGFSAKKMGFGYFQVFLNSWAFIEK